MSVLVDKILLDRILGLKTLQNKRSAWVSMLQHTHTNKHNSHTDMHIYINTIHTDTLQTNK